MTTTETITAELVRNDKLHLSIDGSASACAGRRLSRIGVTATVTVAALPLGIERATVRTAGRKAAQAELSTLITPALRPLLCEKCAASL